MSDDFKGIRLLVTDFDGTIFDGRGDFSSIARFHAVIREIYNSYNARWAVCTGRGLQSVKSVLKGLIADGIQPDYIITGHRFIYSNCKYFCVPHIMWNIHIGSIIRKDLLRIRKTLDNMETFLRSGAAGSRTFEKRPDRLVIRFNNPESARSAEGAAGDMLLGEKHLRIIRADRDLDIGVVPYTKGLAVSELASHIGISPREILTIGNGYNDLSMLNENVAFSTGCPLNSEPEVIERVHRIGGHISREESIVGTIDVIKAYISRKIDSSLPDGWIENAAEQSAISHYKRRSSQSRRRHHRPCFNIWLFLLTAYTVLAVFASYGFVPFSRIIMLPIKMIVVAVERILRLF